MIIYHMFLYRDVLPSRKRKRKQLRQYRRRGIYGCFRKGDGYIMPIFYRRVREESDDAIVNPNI
jgi:hypothetical protein